MKPAIIPVSADQALLQSFIEAALDPCVVIDPDGCIVAVNRAWKELPRRNEVAHVARQPRDELPRAVPILNC